MNKKSLLGFFFISLLLASFIFSSNLVLAQPTVPTTEQEAQDMGFASLEEYENTVSVPAIVPTNPSTSSSSFSMERLRNLALVDLWLKGYNSANFSLAGELVKVLLLILIVLLVHSALSYAEFLHGGVRFVVSIIIGLLATFLVSTEALLSSLTSFTALGTAIWIFLPILVLTFFTIMVASSAAPFGMLIQRILWLVYSVYTFLSGIVIFSLAQSKAGSGIAIFLNTYIVNPLYGGANSAVLTGMRTNADAPTAILLMVVSIMVFFIAVVKAPFAEAWLAKLARDEKIMKYQDEIEKAAAKRRTDAKDVDGK
ncbi:MAG: hypothetical protein AABW82_05300 [Nanoarchaeota archaeon]|mgnify:CR=1 FL=1